MATPSSKRGGCRMTGTDARRPVPPTTPIAEVEPPSRGPSPWGFGFLGLAVLIGIVPLGGFMVQVGHHPQWVFLALLVALCITFISGIVGGVLLLRRPPRATWSRLVAVSLVLVVGFLVLAGVQSTQWAYWELIAG